MKNLKSVITGYLSKNTQHAILLTGAWGKGKTYYYKNHLHHLILKTSVVSDASKKYKPVYVSLFGIKSIEEVQSKIALDLLSYRFLSRWWLIRLFQNKNAKFSITLSKLLLRGILLYNGFDKVIEYFASVKEETKKRIDAEDLFICFDDLERRSPSLKIEEFTGYVNSLVENNMKVLIICNEKEMGDEDFQKYKEKIVGTAIEYLPDPVEVIDSIINSKYSTSPVYRSFLQTQKSNLIELVDKAEDNYRHLIYSMDCLHDVYSALKVEILDSENDYAAKCNQEIDHIAKFTLVMAIEFKASKISYADKESFQRKLIHFLFSDGNNPDRIEEIITKFYGKIEEHKANDYKYYNSIFEFVTGANIFSIPEFVKEFKSNFRLQNGQILPQYVLLNELEINKAIDLSDEQYREKTLKMLEYAKEGRYLLVEYQQVYFYCGRFNNLLNFNLQQLSKDLKTAMSLASVDRLFLQSASNDKSYLEHGKGYDEGQEQIRLHGLEIIETFEREKKTEDKDAIIADFLNNLDDLYSKYHNNEEFKRNITWLPIFQMLDLEDFFHRLLQLRPSSVRFLTSFIKGRYVNLQYREESGFLRALNRKLCDHLNLNKENTRNNWVLNELQKKLEETEEKHGISVYMN